MISEIKIVFEPHDLFITDSLQFIKGFKSINIQQFFTIWKETYSYIFKINIKNKYLLY